MITAVREVLPQDDDAMLVGRVYDTQRRAPVPVLVRGRRVWSLAGAARTVSDLFDRADHLAVLRETADADATWSVDDIALPGGAGGAPLTLLPPIDLQAIKACGVTFAGSMIERVIEERSHGDARRAAEVREEMSRAVGADLAGVRPHTAAAEALKERLSARGWWSQYLEVGLGPDPEVFTKGPVLSAVGTGDDIGVPAFSSWNNPEPELVLAVDPRGRIVGVTLGNDVNLRDVEGRSALLLGMAKDNNRSTAIGPFIRVFDDAFTIDDARALTIDLTVTGADGYVLRGENTVSALSRSFEELVRAAHGEHHQYPDGFVLFTGTLFAPTEDRTEPGEGFTHELGDVVAIENARLGALVNTVRRTEELPPWTYGIRSLFTDLSREVV
ncbi:fumarylacetoacetate hydrolase family protein [Microbacterium sp. JZ31]|uniref:fumarylacetoacetate hydrolase family protein n=1 Tax=Microbacterium sp. JZ31 TaxID=1906274 RepID=UPI001EE4B68C|nr:fumarylacetoacetate hydrolase family protein [Microbacterium sp. JZ31]